ESRYRAQVGRCHRLQIDTAAHAPINDKGSFLDPKAPLQGVQKPLQSLGVVPIASEDGNVQGQALGVGGYCQDELRPIRPVVPTVAVLSQVLRTLPFEVNTGQILENQTAGWRKGPLGE